MILIALTPEIERLQRSIWRYESLYRRKRRLARVIVAAVGPVLKRAVAGRAADLVIHFGVPWVRIEELLELQRQIRSSSLDGAKVFEAGLRRVAGKYGIAWHDEGTAKPYWKLGGQ